MRGRAKKTIFFNFLPYECEAAEEYFGAMAEKGWLLQSIHGTFLRFKRIEPRKIRFSVDVFHKLSEFDYRDNDIALEYREYCKEAGWKYLCQKGKVQVFYAENHENAVPIHTDGGEKFKSVFKASLYSIAVQIFITLLFVFNIYMQLFMASTDYTLATNLGLFNVLTMTSVVLINVIEIISFFIWSVKAWRYLKYNEFMPYNNSRQVRGKNIFKFVYAFVLILVLLQFMIANNTDKSTSGVLLIAAVLAPGAILIFIRKYLNRKKYTRNTNFLISAAGLIISVIVVINILGAATFNKFIEINEIKTSSENISLTYRDFGYSEDSKESTYEKFDKSILAKRIDYSWGNSEEDLSYTVFESKYDWVVRFNEGRVLKRLTGYGFDFKQEDFKLPDNVKVYSNNKPRYFVLISKDKIVTTRKGLNKIDDQEFISTIYTKLFINK